jgi:post-segregation antitoxin (ccd killing protein)
MVMAVSGLHYETKVIQVKLGERAVNKAMKKAQADGWEIQNAKAAD